MSTECGMYRSAGESFDGETTTLDDDRFSLATSRGSTYGLRLPPFHLLPSPLSLSLSLSLFFLAKSSRLARETRREERRISLSRVERGVDAIRAPDADCGACR